MDIDASPMAERIEGRLDRLGLEAAEAARLAGLPADFLDRLRDGRMPPPRGRKLVALTEALATSLSWLVGLDPDVEPPPELLAEDQGNLGLLAGDEEALLRAYRRLDLPTRAALVLIARKLAGPEPEEGAARQIGKAKR